MKDFFLPFYALTVVAPYSDGVRFGLPALHKNLIKKRDNSYVLDVGWGGEFLICREMKKVE
jgi:hypothetical protein